jgi:hypothetical protein
MRWLVEVSRVSDGSSSERYCIDARRWQSALQEVRRLRGDEGPLPKLTIELLDAGYRAVDPELKVRYVVSEAPAGTPVTAGAQVRHSTQPPPGEGETTSVPAPPKAPATSTAPAAPTASTAPAATKKTASELPAATPSVPAGSATTSDAPGGQLMAQVIRQRDESPTTESPIHFRELALAVRPGVPKESVESLMRARLDSAQTSLNAGDAQQYVQIAVFDHMFVKRPVRPPIATLAWKNWRGDPVLAFPGYESKAADSSPSSATPSTRPPSWKDSAEAGKPSGAPAPVVVVGSVAPAASATSAPAVAPSGSAAPPAATAAVPRPGQPAPSSPPAASRSSVIPAPVVSVGVRTPPPAAPPASADSSPDSGDIPVLLVPKDKSGAALETPREDELEIAVEVGPTSAPAIDVAVESMPISQMPASAVSTAPAPAEAIPLVPRPASVPPPKPLSQPPPKPISQPPARLASPVPSRPGSIPGAGGAPRRRAPGEDLIGDLFERMHELAFMADLMSGAEFVLSVLGELIPCEGIVVHVFDLAKREFVVVRAHGPNARATLLHRTADDEPLVRGVMSRGSALLIDGAPSSVPPASSSLTKLGVDARAILCGAARLGGRYLGMIELANPAGGEPFHDGEANALDYVCEQFAEFVASRPIVLDADVVVGQ